MQRRGVAGAALIDQQDAPIAQDAPERRFAEREEIGGGLPRPAGNDDQGFRCRVVGKRIDDSHRKVYAFAIRALVVQRHGNNPAAGGDFVSTFVRREFARRQLHGVRGGREERDQR